MLGSALFVSMAVSCKDFSKSEGLDQEVCYFELDFSALPDSQNDRLSELSMSLHDNYFMYKNLKSIPLRVNRNMFLSLDCDRKIDALELDIEMRDMIEKFANLTAISSEQYDLVYETAKSGKITVK